MRTNDIKDLRHGDRVSLVGEVEDPQWGAGLARTQAIILDNPRQDWYIGELEDGTQIEFHIDNIEGIESEEAVEPRYGMDGFLDWFKKKPKQAESGALIPAETGDVIYVSPSGVARYAEAETPEPAPKKKKKGFLESLKEMFTRESGESIFDVFKTTKDISIRPDTTPVVSERPESLFSVFLPPERSLEPLKEKLRAFIPTEGPTFMAPYVEAAKEMFEHVQPSPEPETFEAKQVRQMDLWTDLFEESKEEQSLSKMFGDFSSEHGLKEFYASERVMPNEATQILSPEIKEALAADRIDVCIVPLPRRETVLPSAEDVAVGLFWTFEPIDKLWDAIRKERASEEFQEALTYCQDADDPASVIIKSLAGDVEGRIDDERMALAALLQIPWEYVQSRMVTEKGYGGYDEVVNDEELHEEIFWPAEQILMEAFDLIKPDDLPGQIGIYNHPDYCHTAIMYMECPPSEDLPGEGPGEAFHEGEESEELDVEEEEAPKPAAAKIAKKAKKPKKAKKKVAKR